MTLPAMLATLASPAGQRAALSVLIFHRVLAEPDPLFPEEPDAHRFDQLLRWLRGWRVLPLDAAIGALREGTLPARALAITFDDGYADNHDVALPILQRHGMCATFFIATGFLDGGRMWNDTIIEAVRRCQAQVLDLDALGLGRHRLGSVAERRSAIDALLSALKYLPFDERSRAVEAVARASGAQLPQDLMMRSEQVRALRRAGMQIGGHTRSHPILARLPDDAAYEEIAGGKAELESLLGEPVPLFAYPNGRPGRDYLARHCAMAQRAGYRAAVSTAPGAARLGADPLQIPRFTPWDRTPLRFGLRMVNNLRGSAEVAV